MSEGPDGTRVRWPKLIEKPKPKPQSFEERIPEMAAKRVDYLINTLGASSEILDAQSQTLTGLTLRESLLEKEIEKLQAHADAKKLRSQQADEKRQERDELAEKEIIEGWGENYSMVLSGNRVSKLKKLEFKCPHCGEPLSRPRGALIELWEWRRNHLGSSHDSPIKTESCRCQKCQNAVPFQATTNTLR